ncbi:MAG: hypothetical protein QOH54_3046 [Mycobacterium sp.]|nr:hypothetical protein [Mycobacterium sp.]
MQTHGGMGYSEEYSISRFFRESRLMKIARPLFDLTGHAAADATFAEVLANEARAQPGDFATADSGEAYAAFAAKREPEFTGRWALSRSEQDNA